jgi:hypothetical protein
MSCDPDDGRYAGITWRMKSNESNLEGNLIRSHWMKQGSTEVSKQRGSLGSHVVGAHGQNSTTILGARLQAYTRYRKRRHCAGSLRPSRNTENVALVCQFGPKLTCKMKDDQKSNCRNIWNMPEFKEARVWKDK